MNKILLIIVIFMASIPTISRASAVSGKGTWESTLHARDLDGNGTNDAFFDSDLNITWLANGSQTPMGWILATQWAEQERFGLQGWRLPATLYKGCNLSWYGGTDCGYGPDSSASTGSEMSHLYFLTLGNNTLYTDPFSSQPNFGLINTGNFSNLVPGSYWSKTEFHNPSYHYYFDTSVGYQYADAGGPFFALAVRDGDVPNFLPEPQTYALILTGLCIIIGAIRHRPILPREIKIPQAS